MPIVPDRFGLRRALVARMVTTGYIALFGEFLTERIKLNTAARGFGWSTRQVGAVSTGETVNVRIPLVAVLIHPPTLGMPWRDALELIQTVAPQVRIVICHDQEDLDSQPEMTASGAFYTLLLPLDSRELTFMFAQLDISIAASSIQKKDRPRAGAQAASAA